MFNTWFRYLFFNMIYYNVHFHYNFLLLVIFYHINPKIKLPEGNLSSIISLTFICLTTLLELSSVRIHLLFPIITIHNVCQTNF